MTDKEFIKRCKRIGEDIKYINDYRRESDDDLDVFERISHQLVLLQFRIIIAANQSSEEEDDESDFKWDDDHEFK